MMRPSVAVPTGTLLHLEGQIDVIEFQGVVYLGYLIARELHVDDRADDLYDFAAGHN
jgi:hypothetical protein